MSTQNPSLLRLYQSAYWDCPPQTLMEFINLCIGFLERLEPLHPLFRDDLYLIGDSLKTSEHLANGKTNIKDYVKLRGWDKKSKSRWKPSPLEGGELLDKSVGYDGFRFMVGNLNKTNENNIQITFTSAGFNPQHYGRGSMGIEFPLKGAPEFYDCTFVRNLAALTIDYWRPTGLLLDQYAFHKKVEGNNPIHRKSIGWLTYLRRLGVCNFVPPDVLCEPFGPDGGALITLQRDPISADDPEAVARAIRVRDALLPGGWLSFDPSPVAQPASVPVAG